jgi:hypothetical protein
MLSHSKANFVKRTALIVESSMLLAGPKNSLLLVQNSLHAQPKFPVLSTQGIWPQQIDSARYFAPESVRTKRNWPNSL